MTQALYVKPADVRGVARLAIDATQRMTDLIEAMHQRIGQPAWLYGDRAERTLGITGLVYRSIREITGAVGFGIDQILKPLERPLEQLLADAPSSAAREAVVAAINGVVGDHLADSGNPLALPMQFRHEGCSLTLEPDALRTVYGEPRRHLLVLVHGLCMNDQQWSRAGYSHADELAPVLGASVVHLRYNSGRHISQNGRDFADLLERLVQNWPVPVEDVTLLTHSMGGLVARSACHYAQQAGYDWPRALRHLVFLGTPHHGAPLERGGNWFQRSVGILPWAGPLARLGMLRSAGVTDLRYGALIDEDWNRRDRFAPAPDDRAIVALPADVRCFAIAATLGEALGDAKDLLLGDGLVPVRSALGRHDDPARRLEFAPERQALYFESSHWDLLHRREVGEQVQRWLSH